MGSTLPLVETWRSRFWNEALATRTWTRSRVSERIPKTRPTMMRRPALPTTTGLVRFTSNVGIVTNSQYMTLKGKGTKQVFVLWGLADVDGEVKGCLGGGFVTGMCRRRPSPEG